MSGNEDTHKSSTTNELGKVILQCLSCCCRLDTWTDRNTNSPLISVAQSHIKSLITEVRIFAGVILNLNLSVEISDKNDAITLRVSVSYISKLILEALDVLHLCTESKHDDDDELNALFAKLHILNGNRTKNHRLSEITKDIRFVEEFTTVLSPWIGPNAKEETHTWGLPGSTPSPEFLDSIAIFVERFRRERYPRYVHTYPSENNTPYIVDLSIIPPMGSFGVVRKVTHKFVDETFAQKSFQDLYRKSDRSKVMRELAFLEICSHPNIVDLIEAYETADDPYTLHIVMAPWAPYTLARFLQNPDPERKKALPWFEPGSTRSISSVYKIMLGLANAVGYLHGLSIKHKDIKPENILLRIDNQQVTPYLTDVGISKLYKQGKDTNYCDSTYAFLAPEQMDYRESSLRSDIWQLGCCYALLVAAAIGGTEATERLHVSDNRTDEKCSCNIALEYRYFIDAFESICSLNKNAKRDAYGLIIGMLDFNLLDRFDIKTVQLTLEGMLSDESNVDG
ncbi:kinase-like domain-containing protein [Hypoxylon sp. FL1857]|nr:kinase-like domain-containing protein [Hypoxylon sp. FL1857]